MKRNRELQRLILIEVRDGEKPPELSKYSEAEQVYNSALLIEDGYVDGEAIRGGSGEYVSTVMLQLTSKGHDFLEDLEKTSPQTMESKSAHQGTVPAAITESPDKKNDAALNPESVLKPKDAVSTQPQEKTNRNSILVGSDTNFSTVATNIEIALGVKKYANVLAKLFRTSDDKDLCLAIFGPWGRGKTFLMEQTIEKLTEVNSATDYKVVKFSAWKYPSKPEVWIHLYETFYSELEKVGWFRSIAFKILAGINRHGTRKVWLALIALMITVLPKGWLVQGIVNYFTKLEVALAIGVVVFITLFIWKFWTTTTHLRHHYLSGVRHAEKLGLQAIIGSDLKALLQGWVKVQFNSECIRKGLRLLWLAAFALVSLIILRSYEAPAVAIALSSVVIMTAAFIWCAFKYAAPSPSRILLVVDDLDRCEAGHLLTVVESIKLLLEDADISRRVQVVMLAEEDVLKHAIWGKYKHLLDGEAQQALKTSYDGRRIVRENFDKIFTAHLRLPPLDFSEIYEVVSSFGGRDPLLMDLPPHKAPAESRPVSEPSDPATSVIKHEAELFAPVSNDEKLLIYAAIQMTYGEKHSELGPRSLRVLIFHYQLARMILTEFGAKNWSPALLARFIAGRQLTGTPTLKSTHLEDKLIALVAEQVA